jgi:Fe-S cluster assembly protein SufD
MLTTDVAAGLPAPDWLRTRREAAAERFAAEPLPTARLEEWRYSPVDKIQPAEFDLVEGADEAPAEATAGLPEFGGLAIVRNGHLVSVQLNDELVDAGVRLGPAADSSDPVELAEGPDAFSLANLAFGPEPLVLEVPNGVHAASPIAVVNWIDADSSLVLPRLVLRVGGGGSAEVLNLSRSADVEALVLSFIEVDAAPAARVTLTTVQELAPQVTEISSHSATVASQATVDESLVAVGGGHTRQRNDCRLEGRGASALLTALYYGHAEQVLDFRTFYDHVAPDTTSNLLFKGALDDSAKSVYTGLIRVHPDGRGTNAMQTNRNLKLSDDAWAESVPNLEIETNDVHCAHASTMGPIDSDHRFYLESRGVPPETAERLIVAGFFDEAVERLGVELAQPIARALVDAKIDVGP